MSKSFSIFSKTNTGDEYNVIQVGELELSYVNLSEEGNVLELVSGYPILDEVGSAALPYRFSVENTGTLVTKYTVKIIQDIDTIKADECENKLMDSIYLRYKFDHQDIRTLNDARNEENEYIIYTGTLQPSESNIHEIRLWIDENSPNSVLGKHYHGKVIIEMIQETGSDATKRLVISLNQGAYVAYVGSNGCQNNGVDTTGTEEAESKNSCLGWNANQKEEDTEDYGYCFGEKYPYKTTGWRVAYIENGHAHLISAGSPECNIRSETKANIEYINLANEKAKKYCNPNFVDGDCSDNSDSWAINDDDFYKITRTMNNGVGKHLGTYTTANAEDSCMAKATKECGNGNDLLDTGGYHWFAATWSTSSTMGVYWTGYTHFVGHENYTHAFGLRPIIRLSSSVYITGGDGSMQNPYQLANNQ